MSKLTELNARLNNVIKAKTKLRNMLLNGSTLTMLIKSKIAELDTQEKALTDSINTIKAERKKQIDAMVKIHESIIYKLN